jgi:hypothetical protein
MKTHQQRVLGPWQSLPTELSRRKTCTKETDKARESVPWVSSWYDFGNFMGAQDT